MQHVYARASTASQSLLLSGTPAEEARTAYLQQGASIAALSRAHGVSRAAVRTALADLLPGTLVTPPSPDDGGT